MPLLAYCIAEAEDADAAPVPLSQTIRSLDVDGLRVFFAPRELSDIPKGEIETQALEFHRQLKAIFAVVGVIPFRFPTLIEDETKLQEHVAEHAQRYQAGLKRTRGMVQMDVRAALAAPDQAPDSATRSGAEYLKQKAASARRLEAAIAAVHHATQDMVREWKRREEKNGLRGSLLVPREKVETFKQRAATVIVPSGVRVIVSGPWPATEFLEETRP